ncbi:Endoplasmic reticulum-Golgi intermediate compartment protein 3 [Fasciola gigantica]|uniref:Endoplasmic reticulum-Golgi intermediate compartment protein 3 n=1 Tax=Fasciola gigantica TaxID=46835 RepID=A0A504Z4H4_FASGI|nr:Endoplasmic reticulum-Golgi intermediate compartment protein 3 [Fasciola gigantica]
MLCFLSLSVPFYFRSLLHFFTNTCAIIGGVFTVASLVDAFIYRSTCAIRSHAKGQSF